MLPRYGNNIFHRTPSFWRKRKDETDERRGKNPDRGRWNDAKGYDAARYGTVRHGTFTNDRVARIFFHPFFSSLISASCKHSVSTSVHLRVRVPLRTCRRVYDHVYLEPPRTYSPSNARLEYFQRLSLPVLIVLTLNVISDFLTMNDFHE